VGPRRDPKFQFPSFQVCRFHFPGYSSAKNSTFRVSEFPRPEAPSWVRAGGTHKFQIPSFRVYGAHSWVRAGWTVPKAKTQIANIPQIPSYSSEEYLRREQIPEYRAQFLFPLLFSGTAHSLPRGLGQMGGTRVGGDGVTWRGEIVTKRTTARQNFGLLVISVSTCPPPGPDLDGTHAPPPAPDLTPGRDGHHRHGTVVVAECA
jgi:hypothetical protein